MFYILSKVLSFLILPTGIVLILILSLIKIKNHTKRKWLGLFTFSLTYLFSMPTFVNEIARHWEYPQVAIDIVKPHKIGILLTGGLIDSYSEFPDNIGLGNSGDRLWQTLHLYQKGKIDTIIISSGDISILGKKKKTEIDYALAYLLQNQVPRENIYLENTSRNTAENARNTSLIFEEHFDQEACILITSAYHMKRADACFKKHGMEVTTFSTNILYQSRPLDVYDFVPNASTFKDFNLIYKEMIGFLIYKVMGYV